MSMQQVSRSLLVWGLALSSHPSAQHSAALAATPCAGEPERHHASCLDSWQAQITSTPNAGLFDLPHVMAKYISQLLALTL
eukprot:1713938-Amphidinium_carterae.2